MDIHRYTVVLIRYSNKMKEVFFFEIQDRQKNEGRSFIDKFLSLYLFFFSSGINIVLELLSKAPIS